MKLLILILMTVLAATLAQADITVESFAVNPPQVSPGGDVILELTLENAGDEDIENVIASLDLRDIPFAPVGSSTESAIDEIRDHRKERVLFTLKALPSAVPATYKIPVVVSYSGTSRTSFISLEVIAVTQLEVLVGDSDPLIVGKKSNVILKFVNNGLGDVRFLTVRISQSPLYSIVSPSSVYIGDVDTADFETEEFIIVPHAADPIVAVELEYRDSTNRQYVKSTLVQLSVYSQGEADALGLGEPRSLAFPFIIGILILVLAIFAYKKVKKRRTHES
ncbi:MAG TPA: hypothetical protein VJI32_02300 [Candidatus Nanoarchaeia archaeon]|nr:hypothetical protein [Candidatus Nanoarchaeia archaeon]